MSASPLPAHILLCDAVDLAGMLETTRRVVPRGAWVEDYVAASFDRTLQTMAGI